MRDIDLLNFKKRVHLTDQVGALIGPLAPTPQKGVERGQPVCVRNAETPGCKLWRCCGNDHPGQKIRSRPEASGSD